jgi:hypothetical protein
LKENSSSHNDNASQVDVLKKDVTQMRYVLFYADDIVQDGIKANQLKAYQYVQVSKIFTEEFK